MTVSARIKRSQAAGQAAGQAAAAAHRGLPRQGRLQRARHRWRDHVVLHSPGSGAHSPKAALGWRRQPCARHRCGGGIRRGRLQARQAGRGGHHKMLAKKEFPLRLHHIGVMQLRCTTVKSQLPAVVGESARSRMQRRRRQPQSSARSWQGGGAHLCPGRRLEGREHEHPVPRLAMLLKGRHKLEAAAHTCRRVWVGARSGGRELCG